MIFSRREFGGLAASSLALVPGAAGAADSRTQIPFRVTRNQPWTAVSLNGKDPLAFLIDTGSNTFGISAKVARDLKLTRIGSAQLQSAIGRRMVDYYEAREVSLGGGAVRERNVQMGAFLPDDKDLISGILPVAKWAIMGLDFDLQQLTIATRLDEAGAPEGYETLETTTQGESFGTTNRLGNLATDPSHVADLDQRPVITGQLDGEAVRLLVDTGANTMLFLYPDYVKSRGLWDHYPRHLESGIVTAAGDAETRIVRAEKLRIGRYAFTTPIVEMGNPADATRDGSKPVDGIIGMEVLRRLNFLHHPTRRRFYFRPSKAIMDVYRQDRAGMHADLADEAIRVTWLDPEGPAAKAGLRLGDKVTGWRGTDGYYGLMWALRGPAGSRIDVQLDRDGKPEIITVVLEDRI